MNRTLEAARSLHEQYATHKSRYGSKAAERQAELEDELFKFINQLDNVNAAAAHLEELLTVLLECSRSARARAASHKQRLSRLVRTCSTHSTHTTREAHAMVDKACTASGRGEQACKAAEGLLSTSSSSSSSSSKPQTQAVLQAIKEHAAAATGAAAEASLLLDNWLQWQQQHRQQHQQQQHQHRRQQQRHQQQQQQQQRRQDEQNSYKKYCKALQHCVDKCSALCACTHTVGTCDVCCARRWQQMLATPVMQQHCQDVQVPEYGRDGCMRCKQCLEQLPVDRHIVVHVCSSGSVEAKQLSWQQLQQLAQAAGHDSPLRPPLHKRNPHHTCFLCGARAEHDQPHACTARLWHLLCIDQSQLSAASPAEGSSQVLGQMRCSQARQLHHVVQVVFRAPEYLLLEWLPPPPARSGGSSSSSSRDGRHPPLQHLVDEDKLLRDLTGKQRPLTRNRVNMDEWWSKQCQAMQLQQMAASSDHKWPLLRCLVVVGPSSFVPGQQGGFALLEPDHAGTELGTGSLQQGVQRQIDARSTHDYAAPTITRSLFGCYVGALRTTRAEIALNLAEVRTTAPGKRKHSYHEPCLVGSIHVLFNQGHGFAAVLEGTARVTFTRTDGSKSEPQMLMRVDRQWNEEQQQQQQRGAGGLVELTWSYNATTTDPDDPLLRVRCLCVSCTVDGSGGQPLITYQPMCTQ